jgi:hypothetical protein
MQDKIYVGQGKEKTFDWGSVNNVTLSLDDLVRLFNDHGYVDGQGSRKIRVTVCKRKTVGEYGYTHYVTLDTWHPAGYAKPTPIQIGKGSVPPEEKPKSGYEKINEGEIPF